MDKIVISSKLKEVLDIVSSKEKGITEQLYASNPEAHNYVVNVVDYNFGKADAYRDVEMLLMDLILGSMKEGSDDSINSEKSFETYINFQRKDDFSWDTVYYCGNCKQEIGRILIPETHHDPLGAFLSYQKDGVDKCPHCKANILWKCKVLDRE